MHRVRITALALFLAALFGFAVPQPVAAQAPQFTVTASCADFAAQNNVVVLNISFPGLKTTVCAKSDGAMREYAYVDTFGNYVVTFYLWFAGAAGTLAVFMVMYGGFEWITAAGNAGRIGQAKETITGAIIGLILLLGSYVLLSTISTGFVNFQLFVKPVERIPLLSCYQASASKQCADAGNSCGGLNAQCGLTNPLSGSSACACTIQCAPGEVWRPYKRNCQDVYTITDPSWDLSVDPGSGPVVIDSPITFGQLYEAANRYFEQTQGRKWDGHPKGITQFLEARGAEQLSSHDNCTWLNFPMGTPGCPSALAIQVQWTEFYEEKVQDKTKLIIGGNRFVCCQSSSDTSTCTARDAVRGSKSTTCGAI
jgi:hypothetical protein